MSKKNAEIARSLAATPGTREYTEGVKKRVNKADATLSAEANKQEKKRLALLRKELQEARQAEDIRRGINPYGGRTGKSYWNQKVREPTLEEIAQSLDALTVTTAKPSEEWTLGDLSDVFDQGGGRHTRVRRRKQRGKQKRQTKKYRKRRTKRRKGKRRKKTNKYR